jgi:hypothetical protein
MKKARVARRERMARERAQIQAGQDDWSDPPISQEAWDAQTFKDRDANTFSARPGYPLR